VADGTQAAALTQDLPAKNLMAASGDATNEIVASAKQRKMGVVIPPKKNQITKRRSSKKLYKLRDLVENAFLKLKGWRGIATRYAKRAASFGAAVQIRCLCLWLKSRDDTP
jgi:transposase